MALKRRRRPSFVDSYSAGAATDAVAGVAAWFSVWVALGVAAGAVYFGESVKIQKCINFGERCIKEGGMAPCRAIKMRATEKIEMRAPHKMHNGFIKKKRLSAPEMRKRKTKA